MNTNIKLKQRILLLRYRRGIRAILRNPLVPLLLDSHTIRPNDYIGWGSKNSGKRAQALAQMDGSNSCLCEDGFVRSLGLGKDGHEGLSLVIDRQNNYTSADYPSDLEDLICKTSELSKAEQTQVEHDINTMVEQHISKYNHAPCTTINTSTALNVLVVDQTFGDTSITGALANGNTFMQMLAAAIANHPQATIWVKTHPDVLRGHNQGYLSDITSTANVVKLTDNINPIYLIKQMDAVYTVSSHMGFEALLCNKTVYCFGMPWYAGWGLTIDTIAPSHVLARRSQRMSTPMTLLRLFYCAYHAYSHYMHPITRQLTNLSELLAWMATQVKLNNQLRGRVCIVGLSMRKRLLMRGAFGSLVSVQLEFSRNVPARAVDHIVLWGSAPFTPPVWFQPHLHKVWRMEDGFIRSVGLGVKLAKPQSLVLDDMGIYYNAQQPSRLEHILQNIKLSDLQAVLIQQHIQQVIDLNITKYNVGAEIAVTFSNRASQKIILVPGQVEDDASIRYGGGIYQRNIDLLQAVRERQPEAYIVYKPHPDVLAKLRKGRLEQTHILAFADLIIEDISMAKCLTMVDEVHTITSLTGFEALMRNIPVVCYGQPFYAGWGLTVDVQPIARRTRKLCLAELVYGVLIDYPLYFSHRHDANGISNFATTIAEIHQQKQTEAKRSPQNIITVWVISLVVAIRAKLKGV